MTQEKDAVRTTANQKLVINKVIVSGKFFQIDEATFSAGCKELKPYTFLVWQAIHCAYFSSDKELALSTSHLAALMNAKRQRTVIDAVAELVKKGWLKLIAGNHYELINPVYRNSAEILKLLPLRRRNGEKTMVQEKKNNQIIYSFRIASILMDKGFKVVDTRRNVKDITKFVWFFEDTPELQEVLAELIKQSA